MTGPALYPAHTAHPAEEHAPPYTGMHDAVLDELCSMLFSSLPRSDQRRRGAEYVRGLLDAEGRKSVRNIAAVIGGQATEQGLHHFVSSSTWSWAPVRRALAQYLARLTPPQAWVVRPLVIPKAGENSVGVDRRFLPSVGQVLNAQQAVGVWASSEECGYPVNWRLHLSSAWLEDGVRRSRASIPDEAMPQTLGECAVEACVEMASEWGLPVRPVVLDSPDTDVPTAARRLRGAGIPLMVRAGSMLPLTVADPALLGRVGETLPAHRIMDAARDMRRPVLRREHARGAGRPGRTGIVSAVRVALPVRNRRVPAPRPELLLLATGEAGRPWPAELWLTDLLTAPPAALLHLSRLTRRVHRDTEDTADRVGIRDFTGRSFGGWHRHVTLASVAYAVAALTGSAERQLSHV